MCNSFRQQNLAVDDVVSLQKCCYNTVTGYPGDKVENGADVPGYAEDMFSDPYPSPCRLSGPTSQSSDKPPQLYWYICMTVMDYRK